MNPCFSLWWIQKIQSFFVVAEMYGTKACSSSMVTCESEPEDGLRWVSLGPSLPPFSPTCTLQATWGLGPSLPPFSPTCTLQATWSLGPSLPPFSPTCTLQATWSSTWRCGCMT